MRALSNWIWHLDWRSAELLLASLILMRGCAMLVTGDMMAGPMYSGFLAIMPERAWGILFTIAGATHIAGVLINGRWRRSPPLRLFCGIFSFWAFTSICFAFYVATGFGLGTLVYGLLSAWLLFCLMNASGKRRV